MATATATATASASASASAPNDGGDVNEKHDIHRQVLETFPVLSPPPSSPLLNLSDDLNQHILQYLDWPALLKLEQTCLDYRCQICPTAWKFLSKNNSDTQPRRIQSSFGATHRERCVRYLRTKLFTNKMERAARTHWQYRDIDCFVFHKNGGCKLCHNCGSNISSSSTLSCCCLPQMEGTGGKKQFRKLEANIENMEWFVSISMPSVGVIWEGFCRATSAGDKNNGSNDNNRMTRNGAINLYFGKDGPESTPSFQQMLEDIEEEDGGGPFQDWVGRHSFTVVAIDKEKTRDDNNNDENDKDYTNTRRQPICRLLRSSPTGGVLGTRWRKIDREERIYTYDVTTLPNFSDPHGMTPEGTVATFSPYQNNMIRFAAGIEYRADEHSGFQFNLTGVKRVVPYLSFEIQ